MRPLAIVFLVILPQALSRVLAPLASNSLELVKTTSIAALVALPELLRSARVAQELKAGLEQDGFNLYAFTKHFLDKNVKH